jgi:hypothetical protein
MVDVFTIVMLALGIAVLVAAVIMIVGFVIPMFVASADGLFQGVRHHGHIDQQTHVG